MVSRLQVGGGPRVNLPDVRFDGKDDEKVAASQGRCKVCKKMPLVRLHVCKVQRAAALWPRVKMTCHLPHAQWTVSIILWSHDVFQPSDQAKHSYQCLFNSNKQISSELVCGNSFVKILCTHFSCIYLVIWPPTFPPGKLAVFRKVLIRLSSNFVRTYSWPTVASAKQFQRSWTRFSCTGGKRLNVNNDFDDCTSAERAFHEMIARGKKLFNVADFFVRGTG